MDLKVKFMDGKKECVSNVYEKTTIKGSLNFMVCSASSDFVWIDHKKCKLHKDKKKHADSIQK